MGKITFGNKSSMADKAAKVENCYGGTTGASKGGNFLPKSNMSLKGANPMTGGSDKTRI